MNDVKLSIIKISTSNSATGKKDCITIHTQYHIDDVEVKSNNKPDEQGRYYFINQYNYVNFAGMTKQQGLARIKKDLFAYGKNLIQNRFMEINNDSFVQLSQDLVGSTATIDTADIKVDTDNDGVPDTIWHVKTDGTKTEDPIITE